MSANCCEKSSAEIHNFSFLKVVSVEIDVIQIKEKHMLYSLYWLIT